MERVGMGGRMGRRERGIKWEEETVGDRGGTLSL